jgi:hypothetical protein
VRFVIEGGLYFFIDILLDFGDFFGEVLLVLLGDLVDKFFLHFHDGFVHLLLFLKLFGLIFEYFVEDS